MEMIRAVFGLRWLMRRGFFSTEFRTFEIGKISDGEIFVTDFPILQDRNSSLLQRHKAGKYDFRVDEREKISHGIFQKTSLEIFPFWVKDKKINNVHNVAKLAAKSS